MLGLENDLFRLETQVSTTLQRNSGPAGTRFGWCTKGRKPILLSSTIRSKVEVTIREVAEKSND